MRKVILYAFILAAALLLLTGCTASTVDQMYAIPERSEVYLELQSEINAAMQGREFSSPRSGENQQTVQTADLNGDGVMEYLVFTKSQSDSVLEILIFGRAEEKYRLLDTLQCHGASFDQIEYVYVDDKAGYDIVVGSQLADDVVRTLAVFSFSQNASMQLLSTNYTEFYPLDLNLDERAELIVLRPGDSEEGRGVAEYYTYVDGTMERSVEAGMSQPAENLKRIIPGTLNDGLPALYVASTVDENSIITDVFADVGGTFTNVSFSNESGTSVHTLRNYFVYAEDIDKDGVIELPDLIAMPPLAAATFSAEQQHLIRWYSMDSSGSEVDKLYTYHNFGGGWYVVLAPEYASRVFVIQNGAAFDFYLWDDNTQTSERIMTLYTLTGQNREEQAEGKIVLYQGDSIIYAAELSISAKNYAAAAEALGNNFHLIHRDWKTGET